MRIQIIEKDKQEYKVADLNWFKGTCDTWVSEYGVEELDWLHAETIDLSCDVFLEAISPAQAKIGFVRDDSHVSNTDQPLHWVTVTALDNAVFDALSQVLIATIGTSCIRSVTGGFSTDLADVKAVLNHGAIAYCSIFDWNTSQQVIEGLRADMSRLESPVEVASCVMLLNQGLQLSQTFENVQSLMSTDIILSDCLIIMNVTNAENIPPTNVLMCVCKDRIM